MKHNGTRWHFRSKLGLAVCAATVFLMTVASVHAASPPPVFGGLTTPGTLSCTGNEVHGTEFATPINSAHGVSLSSSGGSLVHPATATTDCIQMYWIGSGSGAFNTPTLPAQWNFSVTPPANTTNVNWSLFFGFNSLVTAANRSAAALRLLRTPRTRTTAAAAFQAESTFTGTCSTSPCNVSVTGQNVNTPNGNDFTDYQVLLQVNATWTTATASNMTVSVPANTSIDINPFAAGPPPPPPPPPGVPAPSALVLTILGFGALALSRVFVKHRDREAS